ncbi:MAG TPA: hypothetical protein VLE47_01580 [Candidatus Saccharimonadales bacterium]|nr:hypothetical protein [Candidatus Saccharimonadales bacterium]
MLTKSDLRAIGEIVKPIKNEVSEIKETLDRHSEVLDRHSEILETHTGSLIEIEQKIDSALELRQDVSEVRIQAKDHEQRISELETH